MDKAFVYYEETFLINFKILKCYLKNKMLKKFVCGNLFTQMHTSFSI